MSTSSARRREALAEGVLQMNIHAQMHTAAEKALLAAYDTIVSDLPGDGAVAVKRDNAIEQLKIGLPTKRVEAWHYTDLRRLLTAVPEFDASNGANAVDPVLEGSSVLALLNGVSRKTNLGVEGVSTQRLSEKLQDGSFAPALDLPGLMTPLAR